MRHRLATLLRRLADRLAPDDLITMTITDGTVQTYSYRVKAQPIDFTFHGTPEGDVSGHIDEKGQIEYYAAVEQQKIGQIRANLQAEIDLCLKVEQQRLAIAIGQQEAILRNFRTPPDDPPGYTNV